MSDISNKPGTWRTDLPKLVKAREAMGRRLEQQAILGMVEAEREAADSEAVAAAFRRLGEAIVARAVR